MAYLIASKYGISIDTVHTNPPVTLIHECYPKNDLFYITISEHQLRQRIALSQELDPIKQILDIFRTYRKVNASYQYFTRSESSSASRNNRIFLNT